MSEPAPATPAAAPAAGTPTPTPAPVAAPAPFLGGGTPAPAAGTPPPAGTPTRFFGDHIQKDGTFAEGWTESLRTAGFERLATKAALAKDETTLFKVLDDTLGYVGKKTGISYPKPGATDEDISLYRKDAGVPDSPDAYELKPATLPPGVEWSDETAKGYAEIMHRHHVPQAAAQELLQRHMESVAAQAGAATDQFNSRVVSFIQASEQTYKSEWGKDYETRLEANRAYVQTRFEPEELADPILQAALSHPKIVRLIDDSRRNLREAPLPGVGAEAASGSMSPRQQGEAIMRANPQWQRDPALAARVQELYALEANQQKRRAGAR